jgi:hypothetical protein
LPRDGLFLTRATLVTLPGRCRRRRPSLRRRRRRGSGDSGSGRCGLDRLHQADFEEKINVS